MPSATLKQGCYPAAITPFDAQGRIDMVSVARLLAWYEAGGCQGAVLGGTNGEGPSLSAVEKRDLLREAMPLRGKLDLILGIATSSLDEAKWLCVQAGKAGAAAALVMPPSYFVEAGEGGVEAWFKALLQASPLPILIYNFPKRTGITLSAAMLGRLAEEPMMLGAKDSSGDSANLASYASSLPGKHLFVGDETLLIEALRTGWSGTISGAANVLPDWLSTICAEWPLERESAETKHAILLPALRAIRSAPQPGTHKATLSETGVIERPDVRLPLRPPSDDVVQSVCEAVRLATGHRFRSP